MAGWDGIVGVYEMAAVGVRNMEIEDISSFDTNDLAPVICIY